MRMISQKIKYIYNIKKMVDKTLGEKYNNYDSKLLQAKIKSNFITIPQTTINYVDLHNTLKQHKNTKYVITKVEKHKDEGEHIHIVIQLHQQARISSIHNLIMHEQGEINGSINYQKPDNIFATIQYLKKEETSIVDKPFMEYGEEPKKVGRPQGQQDIQQYKDILDLAREGKVEEAKELAIDTIPDKYLLYQTSIDSTIEKLAQPVKKKFKAPDYTAITLRPKQQEVYNLIQDTPKSRQIIWVTGTYGSGKTTLYNYIEKNYQYGVFNAGQSTSLDNIVYTYNEEGAIIWDLPRTFDFNQDGERICNVIEKFSDFGTTLVSKKYNGKKTQVLGHVVVFSNHEPPDKLKHRDITYINLTPEIPPLKIEDRPDTSRKEKVDKHQFSSYTEESSDEEPFSPVKARILKYHDGIVRLEHPNSKHDKLFNNIIELDTYVDKHSLYETLDNEAKTELIKCIE